MNRRHPPRSPDPRPVDERDWLAQERALAGAAGDRRDALLARALRTPPASRPPADFAASVARMAATAAAAGVAPEPRFERVLVNALLGLLALAGTVVALLWGGQWLALAGARFGAHATLWALLAGACLLLSWLPGGARRLYEATRAVAPA